jgi:AcrR family transcriptional regulator
MKRFSQRKQEILKTASFLFKEKGYTAVTMRDIAKEMNIKAASLYNHIHSKQELLTLIIIKVAQDFTQGMEEIHKQPISSVEKLKKIVALHVQISSNNPNGMAVLNNDWMHLKNQLDAYLKMRNTYEENLRNIITEGIAKGEIINVNPEVVLFSMLTTLRSLYIWIPKKETLDILAFTQELTNVLLTGIVA